MNIKIWQWLSGYIIFILMLFPSLWLNAANEIEMFVGRYQDDAKLTVLSPSLRVSKDLNDTSRIVFKYAFENFSKESSDSNDWTLDRHSKFYRLN